LRGHRRNSWTKDGICWPEELLSKEQTLSHTRVLTFGYDVQVIGRTSTNGLFKHSINLLNDLSLERKRDAVSGV
jgi:protein SERAC1